MVPDFCILGKTRKMVLDLKYLDLMERHNGKIVSEYSWCCVLCGAEESDLLRYRCAVCRGALDAIYDLSVVGISDDADPLRRYAGLLPLRSAARWLGEGNTECIHAERLGARIGLEALFLKDETANPTRSTKDRVASVVLARFAEFGVKRLALASTGNTSTACARAARLRGNVELRIFVGRGFVHRLNYSDHPTVRTHLVDSGFDSAGVAAKQFATASVDVHFEGGFFNPSRRDGLKLTYLEAFDQMPVAPRFVFQAISSGMGLLGAYKGAVEYWALGRLPRLPGFVAVRQASCAPTADAFADGVEELGERHIVANPRGIAEAILRGNPTQTYPYLNAICGSTGGSILSVTDEEIYHAHRLLADTEGLRVCYASAATVAGVLAARRRGMISADQPVLVNLTGADRPLAPTPRELVVHGMGEPAESAR